MKVVTINGKSTELRLCKPKLSLIAEAFGEGNSAGLAQGSGIRDQGTGIRTPLVSKSLSLFVP
jgi:hypothetical protein